MVALPEEAPSAREILRRDPIRGAIHVTVKETDPGTNEKFDAACPSKYDRHGPGIARSVVGAGTVTTNA